MLGRCWIRSCQVKERSGITIGFIYLIGIGAQYVSRRKGEIWIIIVRIERGRFPSTVLMIACQGMNLDKS